MIKLVVFDVDGTMTDGGIYISDGGGEYKKFNVKDGAGIRMLSERKISTMILTGRTSECVSRRAQELKIDYLVQGQSDKGAYMETFMQEQGMQKNEIAYIGDDINDLACIRLFQYTGCPEDACDEVKESVAYICQKRGGEGAVREFVEWLIDKEQG